MRKTGSRTEISRLNVGENVLVLLHHRRHLQNDHELGEQTRKREGKKEKRAACLANALVRAGLFPKRVANGARQDTPIVLLEQHESERDETREKRSLLMAAEGCCYPLLAFKKYTVCIVKRPARPPRSIED